MGMALFDAGLRIVEQSWPQFPQLCGSLFELLSQYALVVSQF
jgi:hypothetical protein